MHFKRKIWQLLIIILVTFMKNYIDFPHVSGKTLPLKIFLEHLLRRLDYTYKRPCIRTLLPVSTVRWLQCSGAPVCSKNRFEMKFLQKSQTTTTRTRLMSWRLVDYAACHQRRLQQQQQQGRQSLQQREDVVVAAGWCNRASRINFQSETSREMQSIYVTTRFQPLG